jgi:ATP-dependent Clp protease ATP-binding subunit ClpC
MNMDIDKNTIEDKKENIEILDIEDSTQSTKTNDLPYSFSMINRYGEDLTAKKYITDPAIERDAEIKKVILTLFTPEKSPILVGLPGIGKTAIVEGLAYRIQQGLVPEALKGYKIVKINSVAMIGNIVKEGNTEAKLQLLVDEINKLDKVILFVDETHTLIGNKENGGLDFANILKPALSRGNLKMIGATTANEYDYYIVKDKAFLRRLEKIEISEPTGDMTVKILLGTIPKLEKEMNVKMNYTDFIKESVMKFIVNMTIEYNRVFESASRYPDVCLGILTKAFSFAIFDNEQEVKFKHIWQAISTTETVYPDVLKKQKALFKTTFANILDEEKVYTYE